jgi:hypothetical protein
MPTTQKRDERFVRLPPDLYAQLLIWRSRTTDQSPAPSGPSSAKDFSAGPPNSAPVGVHDDSN